MSERPITFGDLRAFIDHDKDVAHDDGYEAVVRLTRPVLVEELTAVLKAEGYLVAKRAEPLEYALPEAYEAFTAALAQDVVWLGEEE